MNKLSFFLLAVLALAISTANSSARTQIIEYPSYDILESIKAKNKEDKHQYTMDIVSVEIGSTETVVTVRYNFNRTVKSDKFGYISSATSLIYSQGEMKVFLPVSDVSGAVLYDPSEFPLHPDTRYKSGTALDIILRFPAIPENTDKIDIISLSDARMMFSGIDLTRSNSPENRVIGTRDHDEVVKSTCFKDGNMNTLGPYISKILVYPPQEKNQKKEGEVLMGIIINEDDSIDVSAIKSDSYNFELSVRDAYAKCKDSFKAASIYGVPVKTYFIHPVYFKLEESVIKKP